MFRMHVSNLNNRHKVYVDTRQFLFLSMPWYLLIMSFHLVLGEECLATDVTDRVLEKNSFSESAPCEDIQSDSRKVDEQMKNAVSSNSQLNNLSSPQTSDFPAPEKMLSVVEALTTKQNDLLVNSTPDKEALAGDDGAATGIELISGKKRSFTESTLTVQSVNSVESFGMTQSKKTAESIPDDDDLLSSILGIKVVLS